MNDNDENKQTNGFKITYLFYFLIIFVPQIVLAIFDKPWQTSLIFLVSSILFLIIMNPAPFKEFSIQKDGLTVKLQEAQKVISEAYATLDMLKKSMDPIIRLQADILKTSGTFNSMSTREYLRVERELIEVANQLDLDDAAKYFSDETKNRISRAANSEILELLFKKNHLEEENLTQLEIELYGMFINDFENYLKKTYELAKKIPNEKDRAEAEFLIQTTKDYHAY